ncbi:MAG: sigma-70 family RNA polymerase sigma factor [Gemmataceae bacterium]
MLESPSFDNLVAIALEGNTEGVAELIVRRFTDRLVALAAGKISEKLRRRVEADDIVQSVFRTFFRRLDEGHMELRDWESLWGLLARIAVCRIYRHAERNAAARRSQGREVALSPDIEIFNRDPAPDEVLIAREIHFSLVSGLPEKYRPIVGQLLDGRHHEEIARNVGTSISTVERVHRRARERLRAMLQSEAK